ncbi:hypothetical protein PSV09DRAFT_2025845 [Bipolaris maydis]|uniref:uncharacterized protein n=1 Tax=Cochliobolus heterostrophus TaxID=5016 RepID=UPI0024D13C4C|nr:hypothetical protein J3E74DRAFT_17206 [Bipolaris maydis]KAJ6211858.1 hypothetical protein PSV09DRAFT_2025845 [Bipolaris maydis]KAJ6267214.1 hypothetical protein PSV08DRAFT_15319 [Bipolaris maydis]KAJ6277835.1 hypothetical protein J3E71DRAFT_16538 [Bipolaris maydis]
MGFSSPPLLLTGSFFSFKLCFLFLSFLFCRGLSIGYKPYVIAFPLFFLPLLSLSLSLYSFSLTHGEFQRLQPCFCFCFFLGCKLGQSFFFLLFLSSSLSY